MRSKMIVSLIRVFLHHMWQKMDFITHTRRDKLFRPISSK